MTDETSIYGGRDRRRVSEAGRQILAQAVQISSAQPTRAKRYSSGADPDNDQLPWGI